MNTRLPLAALTLALFLTGCATTASSVRVDKADVDLSKCQSFAWHPVPGDAASLTEQRVRAATMQALKDKGYAEVAENPSCRITYVLSTTERPKARPSVGVGAGGGSGGIGGGIGISLPIGKRKSQVGTFTLDVIDSADNAQIWSGSLDAEFESAELSEEEARAAVGKVLAQFPDRGK